MITKIILTAVISGLLICSAMGQEGPSQSGQSRPAPPPQAYDDCKGKRAGDAVQHTTREGKVAATCVESPQGLVARPVRPSGGQQERKERQPSAQPGPQSREGGQKYSIEQAVSSQAQLHTIAFSGLAFMTGNFGAATFIPPGKVCDFFGFQYMRDIDVAGKGHNPIFLNRVAGNVLFVLNSSQRALIEKSAREEAAHLRTLATMRFPLIKAFYRELTGDIPSGSKGLSRAEVIRYTGEIFAFDAAISYKRAQVFGQIASSLTGEQKSYLGRMKFGNFNTWPEVDVEKYKLPRGTEKLVNVAYMTYASEFFSWYSGSVEADTYFCPERHGTYFGGFYMKDMPAMGKRDYDISMSVTGDSGRDFLNTLTERQRKNITDIIELQRSVLREAITVRRAIAAELRKFLSTGKADRSKVVALGRRYGELDGEMSYYYTRAFAEVNRTLTGDQRRTLTKLRGLDGYTPAPAYLYSSPLTESPKLPDTGRFF